MNQFISDYLERLRQVSSDENVVELYHWFWDNQDEIKRTAEEINRALAARKEARSVPKTFSVQKDRVGKVLEFDGDRFVIEF